MPGSDKTDGKRHEVAAPFRHIPKNRSAQEEEGFTAQSPTKHASSVRNNANPDEGRGERGKIQRDDGGALIQDEVSDRKQCGKIERLIGIRQDSMQKHVEKAA